MIEDQIIENSKLSPIDKLLYVESFWKFSLRPFLVWRICQFSPDSVCVWWVLPCPGVWVTLSHITPVRERQLTKGLGSEARLRPKPLVTAPNSTHHYYIILHKKIPTQSNVMSHVSGGKEGEFTASQEVLLGLILWCIHNKREGLLMMMLMYIIKLSRALVHIFKKLSWELSRFPLLVSWLVVVLQGFHSMNKKNTHNNLTNLLPGLIR